MWISKKEYEKLMEERRELAKAYLDVQISIDERHVFYSISEAQLANNQGKSEERERWLKFKRKVAQNALKLIDTIGPIAELSDEQCGVYRRKFVQHID